VKEAIIAGVSSVFAGFIVLLITQAVYANVPDESDIAKRIVEATAELQWCSDNPGCKNIAQQELNALDLYQKANTAKESAQIFGSALIILPPVLGLLAVVRPE
jgi:hypothetical protein